MRLTNGHDPVAAAKALDRRRGEELTFSGWTRDEARVLLSKVGVYIEAQIQPLQKEIADLKSQIEELQARKFSGVHQRALAYKCGAQVIFDSALWTAVTDVGPGEVPGQSLKWQLCFRQIQPPRLPTKGGPRPETTVVDRRT